jgi:AcrR family transcriptional regulator
MSTNRGPAAAAENRAAIIKAAGEVFAEQGLDAPLNAIAKRAGVGQGSLYRHFPTRESLAFVAFEGNLEIIQRVVDRGGNLADVLRLVTEQAANSLAFTELVARHQDDPRSGELAARIQLIIEATIDGGRAAGTIPASFGADDVLLAIRLVSSTLALSMPRERAELAPAAWRLLGIRLD